VLKELWRLQPRDQLRGGRFGDGSGRSGLVDFRFVAEVVDFQVIGFQTVERWWKFIGFGGFKFR
jgi:hypothetical protein